LKGNPSISTLKLKYGMSPNNFNASANTTNSDDSITHNNNRITKGLQINLRKSVVASTNLIQKCSRLKSYIIFITEPRVLKGRICLNRIKMHYQSQDNDKKPRAAIGHSGDIDIYSIPNLSSHDVCTCIWNRNNATPILLISAYWDGLKNNIPEALAAAVDYAKDKQLQFIIGMDANAHSTTWGSSQDNTRGRLMELFIASNNLEIHNKQNKPTFQTFREGRLIQSTIDLTLTSNLYETPISDWNTSYSFEGSDHRMIHFTINKPKERRQMVFNFSKCNWTNSHKELKELRYPEIATEWNHDTIDQEANYIEQTLTEALNNHCP
jgi:hypothetical protein